MKIDNQLKLKSLDEVIILAKWKTTSTLFARLNLVRKAKGKRYVQV